MKTLRRLGSRNPEANFGEAGRNWVQTLGMGTETNPAIGDSRWSFGEPLSLLPSLASQSWLWASNHLVAHLNPSTNSLSGVVLAPRLYQTEKSLMQGYSANVHLQTSTNTPASITDQGVTVFCFLHFTPFLRRYSLRPKLLECLD
jgi:hypothetical protein